MNEQSGVVAVPSWVTRLKAPFAFNQLDIKAQSVMTDKNLALAVPYFDARAAEDRLDEIFGPGNWRNSYREVVLPGDDGGGFLCRIEIDLPEGGQLVRENGAPMTDIDGFKGGVSTSFKRAFSSCGCRYLHSMELGWFECSKRNRSGKMVFDKWTDAGKAAIEKKYLQLIQPLLLSQTAQSTEKKPASFMQFAMALGLGRKDIDEWIRRHAANPGSMTPDAFASAAQKNGIDDVRKFVEKAQVTWPLATEGAKSA